MDSLNYWTYFLQEISFAKVLFLLGTTFFILSAIGIIRFPKAIIKAHASGIADSLALPLVLLGAGISSNFSIFGFLKIVFIVLFIFLSSSCSTHLVCNALSKNPE